MRFLITACLLFAIAMPSFAQGDKQKPNTLTPKEIADGWILLFDGETTFGWSSDSATITGENGVLHFGGKNITLARGPMSMIPSDYELSIEIAAIHLGKNRQNSGAGFVDRNDNYASVSASISPGDTPLWVKTTLRAVDAHLDLVDRNVRLGAGGRDLRMRADAETRMLMRNIKLRPLNTQSLFNGKDLAGWNVFPNKKSQFTVKDGAINVKDGPGDLQTASKYKDFVLQLDCISNGKHLNSGIFFRCRENEYQNGYEAQIRNEFKAEPQKYLVEEYDPKTNKLVGKKEVVSNAFDFGTGAIYRRVPARKQMSKDGEWFGMTIVAHGNHLATWVNGVQVTDWYDHRPKSDNARTGCKLDAGHISIQGHDPTTDLSFKNFRIAELK